MAGVLTLIEFNNSKAIVFKKVYDKIVRYHKDKLYGIPTDNSVLKELLLYVNVIESWEQDNYNSINYTNYLSNKNIQYVFNKINKIIECV